MFIADAVDVGVVEVGLGGRWDATNVVDADVSVITGISLDHTGLLGETVAEIAAEKAAILKDRGRLVTGPLPAGAEGPVTAQVAATDSTWLRSGEHFAVSDADQAVGGWLVDIEGVFERYDGIFLPLHGRHQVDNLATAVAAVEVFFGRRLDHDALLGAIAEATSPGRIEVVRRSPLVIIDGAHNAQGIEGLASALIDEFPDARRVLVVGFGGGRDPEALLAPLAGLADEVVATAAGDGSAVPADEVAAAAGIVFGADTPVTTAVPVASAVAVALARSGPADQVVVTGSLYVVGEARTALSDVSFPLPDRGGVAAAPAAGQQG